MPDQPLVRPLERDELASFAALCLRAYPGFSFDAAQLTERFTSTYQHPDAPRPYGLFNGAQLLGGMIRHRFQLNFHGALLPLAGLAMVAVDLHVRRRGLGRMLLRTFLDDAAADGLPISALYPFRPDFYRKLGFAYGTPLLEYRLPTTRLPGPDVAGSDAVRALSLADAADLLECYQRVVAVTHGFMRHDAGWALRLLSSPRRSFAGVYAAGVLRGFAVYGFRAGNSFVDNILEIHDVIAETPGAAQQLYNFLRSLSDMAPTAILRSQDEQLLHALEDPRDGSQRLLPSVYHHSAQQGVGIMYRLTEPRAVVAALTRSEHRFGFRRLRVRLQFSDLLRERRSAVTLDCADGAARLDDDPAADVTLVLPDIAAAALLVGSADLRGLLQAGLAEISDLNYTAALHAIFQPAARPQCVSHF